MCIRDRIEVITVPAESDRLELALDQGFRVERIADEEAVWIKQNHLLGDDQDVQDIIDAFEKVTTALKKSPELFQD